MQRNGFLSISQEFRFPVPNFADGKYLEASCVVGHSIICLAGKDGYCAIIEIPTEGARLLVNYMENLLSNPVKKAFIGQECRPTQSEIVLLPSNLDEQNRRIFRKVTTEITGLWRKSVYSNAHGGCVAYWSFHNRSSARGVTEELSQVLLACGGTEFIAKAPQSSGLSVLS